MTRVQLTLSGRAERDRAIKWIGQAPPGTRLTFRDPKRTIPQNEKMWALLSEVATQVEWHGQKLTPDDWKILFLDALKRELRAVPNIEGTGFVELGRSSSNLSKQEFSDLLELIAMFGANHEVTFRNDEGQAA